jgi:hypothetical protein
MVLPRFLLQRAYHVPAANIVLGDCVASAGLQCKTAIAPTPKRRCGGPVARWLATHGQGQRALDLLQRMGLRTGVRWSPAGDPGCAQRGRRVGNSGQPIAKSQTSPLRARRPLSRASRLIVSFRVEYRMRPSC